MGLYQHQKDAVKTCIITPRYALYHEQGLGKTISAIIAADYFVSKKIHSNIVVVCPAFLRQNWLREIAVWSKHVQNYSVFSYEKFTSAPQEYQRPHFIIVDDAHYIKNRKAQRTQTVVNAAIFAKRVLLLTGTPIGNGDILDMYTHLVCLDPKNQYAKYRDFFAQFVIKSTDRFFKLMPKNQSEFMQILAPLSERKLKSECLDLPDKIYTQYYCAGTQVQKHLHAMQKLQLQDGWPLQISEHKNDRVTLSTTVYKSTSEKLKTLFSLLDCIDASQQIVIYCAFIGTLEFLYEKIRHKKYSSRAFHGGVPDRKKQQIIDDFKDNKFKILLATVQSLNVGVTLVNCSNVIYYSRTFSVTERSQSEDRFHRIGQKSVVSYYDIIADGVDTRAYNLIKENKTYDEIIQELQNAE